MHTMIIGIAGGTGSGKTTLTTIPMPLTRI